MGIEARTVVLVEDDPDLQFLTMLMLSRAGYVVRAYDDAREAVPACIASPPAAVVLDWMLPGMSGIEALRELRAHPLTADVPVVMATALGFGENVSRAMEAGAQGYLVKPFGQAELVRTVGSVIEGAPSRVSVGAA
jgi:two-component system, OmpR family, phosphate regulon response regulator PhoB